MSQFILKINLGNDAMQTPHDVRQALKAVVERLPDTTNEIITGTVGEQNIRDRNGNTVGSWQVI